MNLRSPRSAVLVAALYATLAAALLSPQASNTILPGPGDVQVHVGHIVQARAALEEGQFPIRIAPSQHAGWRYPLYQFYSPLAYTVAGLIYKLATPANPYVAYKITILASLLVGGLFTYRLAHWLVGSRSAAILAGALYIAAPYFLINIHARAAFAEVVAQGVLPAALYYSCRCYAARRLHFLLAAGVAWFALATTHLITFLYTAIFAGLLFLFLGIRGRKSLRRLGRVAAAFILGNLLALPALAPTALAHYLRIHDPRILPNPYDFNWLTPLFALLSPSSVAPEPHPGHDTTPHLNPAVGWPILIAAGVVLHGLLAPRRPRAGRRADGVAAPLLVLFGLALFLAWSPFDLWSSLPRVLHVAQFSYRLLAQAMWTGALLGAFALCWLFRQALDGRHTVVGLLLVGMASSSYLPSLARADRTIADLVKQPADTSYGSVVYLPKNDLFPEASPPAASRSLTETRNSCRQAGAIQSCLISVSETTLAPLPMLFYPELIEVKVDGREVAFVPVRHEDYLLVAVVLDKGTHEVTARFRGLPWANWLGLAAWVITLGFMAARHIPLRHRPRRDG